MWSLTFLKRLIPMALIAVLATVAGCSGSQAQQTATESSFTEQGEFSADSAYTYIMRQVDCGPRVPGSSAHAACVNFLTATLGRLGATDIQVSDGKATRWDGVVVPVRNIFARVNPDASTRILLVSHYDSRPWADHDPDSALRQQPIDGANDGASGVGVILEIVRALAANPAGVGVDVLFTDAEDGGAPEWAATGMDDGWCLGSRYFAENLPYDAARPLPRYGILLDMVGAPGAKFLQEYYSVNGAPRATARVWNTAARMGLADRFPTRVGGAINDDHLPLIAAGIPTTDIIHTEPAGATGFGSTWHTHSDNSDNIDRETLDIVGRVVLNTIYSEQP